MLEFKYDTQLLIEGKNLDEDVINDYFTNNFKGDCLLAVGDEDLIKIHFHTNEPWRRLFCFPREKSTRRRCGWSSRWKIWICPASRRARLMSRSRRMCWSIPV